MCVPAMSLWYPMTLRSDSGPSFCTPCHCRIWMRICLSRRGGFHLFIDLNSPLFCSLRLAHLCFCMSWIFLHTVDGMALVPLMEELCMAWDRGTVASNWNSQSQTGVLGEEWLGFCSVNMQPRVREWSQRQAVRVADVNSDDGSVSSFAGVGSFFQKS